MKLQIHSVHFDADQKLLDFIQRKSSKLETFYDRIIDGEVFLRIDKGEHSRENKLVEIKLNIPGATLFAKQQDISFEAATDEAVESLRRQIKKHKEKNSVR
ncbi:ribosome hibernation-promoting factor, HPF/YfiA family [Eisenibacter elegans]|jgi:putative sigma-54 modulation protein|uniref:ribosome hibernation-promoting factor, HPF/YfiA family n=1 Tax=Eisenibacter elegans TaxID=997 RepID=UPI00047D746E|nr:ribosome-associated translation inhibitor RaiA [Eisenibacter elegans]